MDKYAEQACIKAAQEIFSKNYNPDEYSLNGASESAICLEKNNENWEVYEFERNSKDNKAIYSNIVEALLNMIDRLAGENASALKESFLTAVIGKQTA